MNLYANNVPYKNTNWDFIVVLLAEDSIFSLGDKLYSDILTTIVACAVLGLVIMSVVIRCVTRPVYRLMDSIRSGIAGLKRVCAFRYPGSR